MREQEMRQRVFCFLKARMRNMLMPATVGIGIAMGGCTTSTPIYSAPLTNDAAQTVGDVLGQDSPVPGSDLPLVDTRDAMVEADAAPDLPSVDTRDAMVAADGAPDLAPDLARDNASPADKPAGTDSTAIDGGKSDAVAALDSNDDLGVNVTKYSAPVRDAGIELGAIEVYSAPVMPDAAADSGLAVRYGGQFSDSGGAMPLYMAP
jgi:hypothetical protein